MKLMIPISQFYYIRVTLISWRINGPTRINNLDKSGGDKLADLIKERVSDNLPYVIDMKGIVGQTDGALVSFFDLIKQKKLEIIIINYEAIAPTLNELYREYLKDISDANYNENDGKLSIHFSNSKLSLSGSEINNSVRSTLLMSMKELISNTFKPNSLDEEKYCSLSSTPILSTGQYDASLIISNPDDFTWISLLMADLVYEIVQSNKLLNATLLTVSLRGSPFASAISMINSMTMHTIDHLGPFQKVWNLNKYKIKVSPTKNYIFIGDFIIGGTELKLARLYSHFGNSELNHSVVIGALFEDSRYNSFSIKSLVNLRDLNSKAKFKLFES